MGGNVHLLQPSILLGFVNCEQLEEFSVLDSLLFFTMSTIPITYLLMNYTTIMDGCTSFGLVLLLFSKHVSAEQFTLVSKLFRVTHMSADN